MKISKRLKAINQLVPDGYDHIWDCCCDHGVLGMLLLERKAAPTVHFVDQVPAIMALLEARLQQYFPLSDLPRHAVINTSNMNIVDNNHSNNGDKGERASASTPASRWQVHCQDVGQISLIAKDSDKRHLVIIAGVGGECLIELVKQILAGNQSNTLASANAGIDVATDGAIDDANEAKHYEHQQSYAGSNGAVSQRSAFQNGADNDFQPQGIDFLLCPVHHTYHVRQSLTALGLGLLKEQLIEENHRFYELLYVSTASKNAIPEVGDEMWQTNTVSAKAYLTRLLTHYRQLHLATTLADTISDTEQNGIISSADVTTAVKEGSDDVGGASASITAIVAAYQATFDSLST